MTSSRSGVIPTPAGRGRAGVLVVGVACAVVLLFALAPGSFDEKLSRVGYAVSGQRPGHSFVLGGVALPLEARMGGIFAGVLLGALYLLALGRERATLWPGGFVQWGALLGIALMAADGLNATLHDLGLATLYAPRNDLRLATGLLAGYGTAILMWPAVMETIWRECDLEPALGGPVALLGGLLAPALYWALVVSGQAELRPLLGLVAVLGVVAGFTLANTYLLLLVGRRAGRAATWGQALPALAAGFLASVVELLLLASWHAYTEHVLGVRWPV